MSASILFCLVLVLVALVVLAPLLDALLGPIWARRFGRRVGGYRRGLRGW